MIKVRAEEKALMIYNRELARTAYISAEELDSLDRWTKGENNGFCRRLLAQGIICDNIKPQISQAILESSNKKAPINAFCAPESIHIELTNRCPFACPQCYKKNSADDISFDVLLDAVDQADKMGVFQIALGGGEPLIYKDLLMVVNEIDRRSMSSSVTSSEFNLSHDFLSELKEAELDHIQISLNGSDKKIDSYSRAGYEEAIAALNLLKGSDISYGINWVARQDNIDDLPELILLVKSYQAENINILRYKPSLAEKYEEICLSSDKLNYLKDLLSEVKGINIKVDSAFSNLLCALSNRTSFFSGCGAGRRFLALDAQGHYRPCSHIDWREKGRDLKDIWYNSENLEKFRMMGSRLKEPCRFCSYLSGCGGCRAIALKHNEDFYSGDLSCPFHIKL